MGINGDFIGFYAFTGIYLASTNKTGASTTKPGDTTENNHYIGLNESTIVSKPWFAFHPNIRFSCIFRQPSPALQWIGCYNQGLRAASAREHPKQNRGLGGLMQTGWGYNHANGQLYNHRKSAHHDTLLIKEMHIPFNTILWQERL